MERTLIKIMNDRDNSSILVCFRDDNFPVETPPFPESIYLLGGGKRRLFRCYAIDDRSDLAVLFRFLYRYLEMQGIDL